jgi:hypothetical protein
MLPAHFPPRYRPRVDGGRAHLHQRGARHTEAACGQEFSGLPWLDGWRDQQADDVVHYLNRLVRRAIGAAEAPADIPGNKDAVGSLSLIRVTCPFKCLLTLSTRFNTYDQFKASTSTSPRHVAVRLGRGIFVFGDSFRTTNQRRQQPTRRRVLLLLSSAASWRPRKRRSSERE